MYPWEHQGTHGSSHPTADDLITQLRTHAGKVSRCLEQLQILTQEKQLCTKYWEQQRGAITAAIARVVERRAALEERRLVPPCSSLLSRQPQEGASWASFYSEHAYCNGLYCLLEERLSKVEAQLCSTVAAFAGGAVSAPVVGDEYQCNEEAVEL